MSLVRNILIGFLLIFASQAYAFTHKGNSAAPNWVIDYYRSYSGSFNHSGDITVMPFGWFLTSPAAGSGHVLAPYTNNATAAVGLGAPIMFPADANFPTSFGVDNGDAAAAIAANAYMIGAPGAGTDYNSTSSTASPASMIAAYNSVGALLADTGNWIIDEPGQTTGCTSAFNPAPPDLGGVPTAYALTKAKDPAHWALVNSAQLAWYHVKPAQIPCGGAGTTYDAAFVSSTIPMSDTYSCINPNNFQQLETYAFPDVQNTDGATHGTDCVFTQGIATAVGQELIAAHGVKQPQGTFIAPLSNALTHNYTAAGGFGFSMTAGSDVISVAPAYATIVPGIVFTSQLFISPPGGSALVFTQHSGTTGCFTGNIHITSIINATSAHTDVNTATNGTCTWNGGANLAFVDVTGGTAASAGWCNQSLGICPGGAMIRDTVATALGQEFEHMDNGGLVLLYFGYDDCEASPNFALGDPSPGVTCPGGSTVAASSFVSYTTEIFNGGAYNLTKTYQLPTDGRCNMTKTDGSGDLTSCTDGGYTMATGVSTCPGVMIVKHDASFTYVHAMSNRQSWSAQNCGASVGAVMTFSGFSALNGHTVTVFYDTNSKNDVAHDHTGNTTTISGGSFSFTFGANGNGYEHMTLRIS